MNMDEKKLIVAVVGNIISQYLSIVKEHKEISEKKYTPQSGFGYDRNVDKCSKGIVYAERIMDNLPYVLFRDKVWTKEELSSVFHNVEFKGMTLSSEGAEASDENTIANNVIIALESIGGIKAKEILPSLIGYTSMRAERELVDGEKWSEKVNGAKFGKAGVNYGKTRDFDILFGTDKTDLLISFETPYMLLRREMIAKIKDSKNSEKTTEDIIEDSIKFFTKSLYPSNFGSLIMSATPCAKYQRRFADNRHKWRDAELEEEQSSGIDYGVWF